jgi:hypothetical protein
MSEFGIGARDNVMEIVADEGERSSFVAASA